MMKKLLLMSTLFTAALGAMAVNGEVRKERSAANKCVEISFDYTRKPGGGSNQYAVWIENENKEVVKTLFVTSFTTKGRARDNQPARRGYTFRPACVPTWVTNAKAAELSDEAIDAFTGATPKESGKQTFRWNFTDEAGKVVAKGNYKVCIEATLKDECRIIFTGTVSTRARSGEIPMKAVETGHDEAYAGMVTAVKAVVK